MFPARIVAVVTAMALGTACSSDGAELAWPQFRGPGGQGHSTATNLPTRWNETENVTWKTPLPGEGWSSPVLGLGGIWLTAASTDGLSLRALCVDPTPASCCTTLK